MIGKTTALRRLLAEEAFIHLPVAYDALGGRLIEKTGFKAAYVGGFVTGGSRCSSEPLLTLDEQVRVAGDVARAVALPVLADAGAGFGEPLHTMRTVREFIHAGIAGIHIEDQLFPKRAHYHKYVAHVIPRKEFADKIRLACRQRDRTDKDFVIIARSDSCRFEGLDEAVGRLNLAAENGADMGMIFPRDLGELQQAPKLSKIPLVYVVSRGNRDNRPVASAAQLADMGYKVALDALLYLLVSFHFNRRALEELKATGDFSGLSPQECVTARHDIEATTRRLTATPAAEVTTGARASLREPRRGACRTAKISPSAPVPPIGDDVIPNNQPPYARENAACTGVGELGSCNSARPRACEKTSAACAQQERPLFPQFQQPRRE